MVDFPQAKTWLYRLLFLGISGLIIFFHLLPLRTTPGAWPGPDLLQAFTYAFVLRRPEYVPLLLIASVMFIADMLFQRPPGLQAALVVIASEFLRRRHHLMRDLPFLAEWGIVAALLIALTLTQRLILMLFLVPRPALGPTLIQLAITIAVYPLVVVITRHIFGVRMATPAERDAVRIGT